MKVGYVRVSTKEQNTIRQELKIRELGVDKLFIEKISGKNTDRPELKNLMHYVREGDTVIVESYSRFARSTRDLLSLIDELDAKKVGFVSLKENISTTTPQGKLMMTIFAGLAEFERECLLQRQREGIDIAVAEGRFNGRPKKEIPDFERLYDDWKNKRVKVTKICSDYGISRSTWYQHVKRYESGVDVIIDFGS